MTKVIGSPMVEASLKMLQEDSKIWLTFTHDTDIEMYLTSLGLIVPPGICPLIEYHFPIHIMQQNFPSRC